MNKFIKKGLAIGLATMLTFSGTSLSVFANSDLVNSDGSVNNDVGNVTSGSSSSEYSSKPNGVTGYDDSQDRASEYKSIDGTTDQDSNVNVYTTQEESAEIIIPKTIILDGTNTTAAGYKVKVRGNIAGDSAIRVVPESNESTVNAAGPSYNGSAKAHFYLGSKGKQDVIAEVSQVKDSFLWDDIKELAENEFAETTGNVWSTISAGMWHGNFNFNIQLDKMNDEEQYLLAGYRTFMKVDLSKTSSDNVFAYYLVPVENTEEAQGTGTSSHNSKLKNSLKSAFSPIIANAEDRGSVVKNGVEYNFSDDDKLIIQGTGKMKSNIINDFTDLNSLQAEYLRRVQLVDQNNGGRITHNNYIVTFSDPNDTGYVISMNLRTGSADTSGLGSDSSARTRFYNKFKVDQYGTGSFNNSLNNYVRAYNNISTKYYYKLPTSVIIKDGVTEISDNSFKGMKDIKAVQMASTITKIGSSGFYNCSDLQSIEIPNSVTSIGTNAFYGCSSLSRVNIHSLKSWCNIDYPSTSPASGNPLTYAHSLYLNNQKITDLQIPSTVTTLKRGIFSGGDFSSISINNNITSIGDYCFYKCNNITSVTIPSAVSSIGGYAFNLCSELLTVNINTSTSCSIGNYCFKGCNKLTNVTIPNTISSIDQYAFDGCSSISNLNAHLNSNCSIGYCAFRGCTNISLSDFDVPDNYTGFIQYNSFTNTPVLNASTWGGKSVLYFGNVLVKVDPSYTGDVHTKVGMTRVLGGAFYGCSNIGDVYITPTPGLSFLDCGSGSAFSSGEESMPFAGIPSTSKIYCSDDNTRDRALDGLWSNQSSSMVVVAAYKFQEPLAENATSVPNNAFVGNLDLTNVVLPNTVTSIGSSAYKNCSNLTSISIPSGFQTVGNNAFQNCTSLTSITFPSSTTSLGSDILNGCTNLTDIYIYANNPSINSYTFNSIPSGCTIHCKSSSLAYNIHMSCGWSLNVVTDI